MATNSFYDIAVETIVNRSGRSSQAQRKLIDSLTEEAPILLTMPMEEATHAYHSVFERLVSVTGPDIVDLDSALPIIDSQTEVGQTNLSKIGGQIFAGKDKVAYFGNLETYLSKKVPPALRKAGMDMEQNIYYNRLLAAAIKYDNIIRATGEPSEGGGYSSIVAVTWTPGEIIGLYSPLDYGNGKVFKTGMVYGGNLCENSHGVLGYKSYLETLLGILIENPKRIGAIVNIGNTLPTSHMIGDLLDSVRSNGSTVLYCHRRMMRWIADEYAKRTHTHEYVLQDRKLTTLTFNEVPFMASFNIQFGTEPLVPIPS
ncbi:MAG: hypothetical protein LBK82_09915 [Planctomycetaceae bacterium]|jgi:hypothetical protein|nr:hypothetical protein [Planctomycetaceae bacterium]